MLIKTTQPKYTPPKEILLDYKNFKGGLNTLFKPTELRPNELDAADNLILTGAGVPTKRWGTANYFLSGATGYGRGLYWAKSANATSVLMAMTDDGLMGRMNGASYTPITGASWASGYNWEATQINDQVYVVNGKNPWTRYNFNTFVSFATLAVPTGLMATNFSGATGSSTYSWRVSALSQVGETLACTRVSLFSLPQTLSLTMVKLQWTPVSAASGILIGYQLYRGPPGDEEWIAGLDNETTLYNDYGSVSASGKLTPESDTTGGPIAKYITRYIDRLLLAGIPGNPTALMISGRAPDSHERFDFAANAAIQLVDPDTGDDITGIGVHQGKIVVFKENSVWQVTLSSETTNITLLLIPSYQLITASQGCSSHRSICAVDNDLFFLGRKGVYVLGYEPGIMADVLRTNELSAKIRPFFKTLSQSDLTNATAVYYDYKYILAFPSAKKCIVFDKERVAWMGPWSTSFGINKFVKYIDSNGVERLLAIDADDNYVSEFSDTLLDDKGVAFGTVLRTKKDDLGDYTIFKTINEVLTGFRNVAGNVGVNVYIEDRDGNVTTAKSFTITGPSSQITASWGTDAFGTTGLGETEQEVSSYAEETIKRALLYKTARYIQFEITTSQGPDTYELLGIKAKAIPQGAGSVPASWNVE